MTTSAVAVTKQPTCTTRTITAFIAALLVGVLSACGGGAKSTQVAVKVNKGEITVLQVNEQLARLPAGVQPEQVESAKHKILDSLVNQQLLVEQAIDRKLDRDPQVLGVLEAARQNILAQAYVQRVIAPQAKPTEQEVKQYYAQNPALFSERKVYRLQELTIEANAEQGKDIETVAAGAKSLKQVAEFLQDKKIPFSVGSGIRTAEQLPLSVLPRIAQLKPGGVLAFETGANRMSAIEVAASESQPVDEKKATPIIEKFLSNRKREELATSEVKRLHDAAKIEYVGDYAKYATADTAVVAAPAVKPALAPASGEKSVTSDQDKGIAGLR